MDTLCRIELFGGLRAHQAGRCITRFQTQKTGALLAYLAYHLHRSHPREVLIDMLWPEAEPAAGRNRLSIALTSLRHQLEPPGIPSGAVIQADRFTVSLNSAAVATDVSEFASLLRQAAQSKTEADVQCALRRAMELYRGELLAGYYDEWVVTERRRLTALHQKIALRVAAEGEKADIDAELAQLAPALLGNSPPVSATSSRLRLPLQLTRFFGRERELAELESLLCTGELEPRGGNGAHAPGAPRRLVTLTGPGGSGKTRLAVELAARLAETFGSSVWFAGLADISDARLIPGTTLDALKVVRLPEMEPLDQLVAYLNGQGDHNPALLILDNYEHLVEDGASMVKTLLERVPNLTCLITSRRRLELDGERELPVPPLPTPELHGNQSPKSLVELASVQLFTDRAQGANPAFQVMDRNVAAVSELCYRLEGIPLAIELAAARAQVMTPAQMSAQLGRRYGFLISKRRDVIDRHRSLQAAIDWSYRLLSAELQRFFAQLSVFRGGWTAEAAEAVCEQPRALEYLEHLRDCSLVRAEESLLGMRFRMLETLREFGQEQMSPDERGGVTERHLAFFLRLAQESDHQINRSEQSAAIWRFAGEHDNLLAALAESRSVAGGAEIALQLVSAQESYWNVAGNWREGRACMAEALGRHEAEGPSEPRAEALRRAAALALDDGDTVAAETLFEEAVTIWRQLGLDRRSQYVDFMRMLRWYQGDYEAARCLAEEYLSMCETNGGRICWVAMNLGLCAYMQGDLEATWAWYSRALSNARETEFPIGVSAALSYMGFLLWRKLGDPKKARTLLKECLAIDRQYGGKWQIARTLNYIGWIDCEQRDYAAAEPVLEDGLAQALELGQQKRSAILLYTLGDVSAGQGEIGAARSYYSDGLQLSESANSKRGIALGLGKLANLAPAYQAAHLYGACETLAGAFDTPKGTIGFEEGDFLYAMETLPGKDGTSFDAAAWKVGCAMTAQEAVVYALKNCP